MPRFQVRRSINIAAPPEKVFETVADFGTWTRWSPWLCAEPEAKVTVTPDASSVGSVYTWNGEVVGQGEIEHQALEPGRRIEEELRIIKPFRSKSRVTFEMQPSREGTSISWQMDGSLPFFMFWFVPQMKTLIGMDYDRGLKMLKDWIETGAVASRTEVLGVQKVEPLAMVGVRQTCSVTEIGPAMETAFSEAAAKMTRHNLPTDGATMSVYHDFDMKAGTFDFTSGFIVPADLTVDNPELSHWSIPEVSALGVVHTGSYEHLGNAWSAANQVTRYKKLKQSRVGAFELYKNDPDQTPAEELRTEIYLPLK